MRHILLFACGVAGFAHYEGADILDKIRDGDSVAIRPEPDNKYDPFAIALFWEGKKLGYVPRVSTALIHRFIKANLKVEGQVEHTVNSSNPNERVVVSILYAHRDSTDFVADMEGGPR